MGWSDRAACKGVKSLNFFPSVGTKNDSPVPPEIKNLCDSCPVHDECLDWACRHEAFGFWAATNPDQRRRLRIKQGIPWEPFTVEQELDFLPRNGSGNPNRGADGRFGATPTPPLTMNSNKERNTA